MIPILDWIFEGIVNWVASVVSQLFDAVSGLFLEALGTDMTAMEEYFPFVTKAYDVMQVTAWAILILITIWQLFRAFGGPITEAENPWHLLVRSSVYGLLIGYAKPIFSLCLNIARAPYTTLMELSMTAEDFTFAGVEQTLTNGLLTIVSAATVVGLILILILEIALGWNYFKLLLETVERYIVVGVLCYTSPLAFSMGGSKTTSTVFKSWCRMVGSQLLLLVMNVWFLRGFASSMGQFIANGGALTTGKGSIFLWMFCALAYLKCAQRFDSYLASIGLNVAQTGSSMGMELMMAARVISGAGSSVRSAGSVFGRGGNAAATGTGAAANGFASGFASRFSPNSYVRDAVVEGGSRMGFNGGAGFVGRAFGGIAARNGATLNGNSISSVAARAPSTSGTIAGDIADRSLGNYMPQMQGFQLQGTQITGGHISTTAVSADGKSASVDMFNASQFEKPEVPHSVVTAADGSQWYQMASGEGRGAFYDVPTFHGVGADIPKELKYVGDDDVNKTSFSRITGALFCPGGCYAVYNSRDYLMNWNGRGEAKVRLHLTEIARMNADVDDVQSAILLGTGYEIAEITLRTLWKTKRAETEFTVIYDHLHFIPLNGFGVRLLKILTTPDWNETLLDLLFDPNDRSYGKGVFEYDARENGIYLFSFLDSDITRLNHFIDGTKGIERETAVICFPEQTAFVRNVVGPKVSIKTVIMDMVEDALCPKGGDADE